jgi:type IV pilus assembly protein PilW
MGLGLVVILIASAALLIGQQGRNAVDSSTQIRDNQRLAVDLLTRMILQVGFEDYGAKKDGKDAAVLRANAAVKGIDPEPDIFGWNNAFYKKPNNLAVSESTNIANEGRPTACGSVNDTSCKNGSDVLVLRYQGVSDNTMLNCAGWGETSVASETDLNSRGLSILYVGRGTDGEPSLQCSYYIHAKGDWSDATPLVLGVESFQILYGTDGVTPGLAPTAGDSIPERWLRADQLTVAGNAALTRQNWRRVRAVRVGLTLRGPVGSAQQSAAATFTPLGVAFTNSASDVGAALAVPADRRLRESITFTVHIRNDLTTRTAPE